MGLVKQQMMEAEASAVIGRCYLCGEGITQDEIDERGGEHADSCVYHAHQIRKVMEEDEE